MENRSNYVKNQSGSQSGSKNCRTTSSTNSTNEHKHPNQYTKGADDEGAQNTKSTKTSSKNCR